MRCFFIDIEINDVMVKDTEGQIFSSIDEIERNVLTSLPLIAADIKSPGRSTIIVATVRDDEGKIVYTGSLTLSGESIGI